MSLVAVFTNNFGPWPSAADYQAAKAAASSPGAHIRAFYHLPEWVRRGCPVHDQDGATGVILGFTSTQMYVRVRMDATGYTDLYHPGDLSYPVADPRVPA